MPWQYSGDSHPMSLVCRIFVCLLLIQRLSSVSAQGLRVETQVYSIAQTSADSRAVETHLSSSVTLLHNGLVYDYVEAADEVIILNPSVRTFTILNTAREIRTGGRFEEIKHLMDSHRKESKRYLHELTRSTQRDAAEVARSLQFQLKPAFDTKFDAKNGLLEMTSDSWKYRVQTHSWDDLDQVAEYLKYADMISRLNFVLHPESMFPEPRRLLNDELRKRERLPTSVVRDLRPEQSLILRASHKFIAGLNSADLHLIQVWDSAARDASQRSLPLRSYQEVVLLSKR
ncbi:MAG: hypothetical protein MK102_03180 [Fuerstiella sp.]|nr:hypothetical protein [Fuerstiella sp.]